MRSSPYVVATARPRRVEIFRLVRLFVRMSSSERALLLRVAESFETPAPMLRASLTIVQTIPETGREGPNAVALQSGTRPA